MNAKSPSTSKHTPGPWRTAEILQDNGPDIIGIFGPRSTSSGFNGFCVAHVAKESDARLIAAAPELLGELRANLDQMQKLQDSHLLTSAAAVTRALLQKRIEATRAIIAKAEGSDND